MTTYIEINGTRYPVVNPHYLLASDNNVASSKAFKLQMAYEDAAALFTDDVQWSAVREWVDDEGVTKEKACDCSVYSIVDSITDHRDGHVTIRMRKFNDTDALNIIVGGNE